MPDEKPLDINEGADKKTGMMLPSAEFLGAIDGRAVVSVEAYVQAFEAVLGQADHSNVAEFVKSAGAMSAALSKAVSAPPSAFPFARISYMPESYNAGVLQWPGIAPEALRKVVRENLAPQLIIGQRVDDVLRYSTLSTHPWRPGWQIESKKASESPDEKTAADIKDAEMFIQNSTTEFKDGDARKRDAKRLMDFQGFLSQIVRDTLTFDGIAVWTDMTNVDQVKSYAAMPASQIRLAGPDGYQGDPNIFAVMVDETNEIIHTFTRDDLVFYVRNRRSQIDAQGYGYSEVEIGIRLIQGFQNAVDLNCDTFTKNAIPNGMLVFSGGTMTQKQLDVLNRAWSNMKKGITKAWSLPVMSLNDGKVEILDLSRLKGMEVYYQDFMNMIIGAFCTIYRFPVRRLGYRISGAGKDTAPLPDSGSALIDDDDPGLAPLLIHIENVINEYLVWSRWPHLRFRFNGKSPKEDAREVEAKKLARTWGEERAESGLPDLEKMAAGTDAETKKAMKLMSLCPADPAKQGVFQTLVGALLAPEEPDDGTPGARMGSKKDAATSEGHGHTAGVRRDSNKEKTNAGSK